MLEKKTGLENAAKTAAQTPQFFSTLEFKSGMDEEEAGVKELVVPSCRICFDEAPPFLFPCACQAPVHQACLDKWRGQFAPHHDKWKKCEVCLTPYNVPDWGLVRNRLFAGVFLALAFVGTSLLLFLDSMAYQFVIGAAALTSFMLTHYFMLRCDGTTISIPFLLQWIILLNGTLAIFVILRLPNTDSVVIFVHFVMGVFILYYFCRCLASVKVA